MLFSKNNLFKKHENETESQRLKLLKAVRLDVSTLYKIKGLGMPIYTEKAFDYFLKHPNGFDGATIVKDLDDLPNLSLSALQHDYCYLVELPKNKAINWLVSKVVFDWYYAKNLEALGK